jgi:hypothetical protein
MHTRQVTLQFYNKRGASYDATDPVMRRLLDPLGDRNHVRRAVIRAHAGSSASFTTNHAARGSRGSILSRP